MNPFAAITVTLLSVASPPESVAVPNVVPPNANVTVPVIPAVPVVVEATDAVNVVVPPINIELGEAAAVVVVAAATPVTVSVVLPVEPAKLAFPP
jgi:hypothetical protein